MVTTLSVHNLKNEILLNWGLFLKMKCCFLFCTAEPLYFVRVYVEKKLLLFLMK